MYKLYTCTYYIMYEYMIYISKYIMYIVFYIEC